MAVKGLREGVFQGEELWAQRQERTVWIWGQGDFWLKIWG